jgi:hypothetical protein
MTRWRLDVGQIEVIEDRLAEALRRKTPAQRVAMISEANETMRQLIAGGLRTRHPEWSDERIRAEVVRRMLGDAG